MVSNTSELPAADVEWASKVWTKLSRWECAGILLAALCYEVNLDPPNKYIETMSDMPWSSLGRPLQIDITKALQRLQKAFGR